MYLVVTRVDLEGALICSACMALQQVCVSYFELARFKTAQYLAMLSASCLRCNCAL